MYSNVSSERSAGTAGVPSNVESKSVFTFDHLSEMNTIREINEPKHIQVLDSYSGGNYSRHVQRIFSNIDDDDRGNMSAASHQTVSTISTGTKYFVYVANYVLCVNN